MMKKKNRVLDKFYKKISLDKSGYSRDIGTGVGPILNPGIVIPGSIFEALSRDSKSWDLTEIT